MPFLKSGSARRFPKKCQTCPKPLKKRVGSGNPRAVRPNLLLYLMDKLIFKWWYCFYNIFRVCDPWLPNLPCHSTKGAFKRLQRFVDRRSPSHQSSPSGGAQASKYQDAPTSHCRDQPLQFNATNVPCI